MSPRQNIIINRTPCFVIGFFVPDNMFVISSLLYRLIKWLEYFVFCTTIIFACCLNFELFYNFM